MWQHLDDLVRHGPEMSWLRLTGAPTMTTENVPTRPRWGQLPGWLVLNVAAMSASAAHVLVDIHLGLFGASSSSMSLLQAMNIAFACLVLSWWVLCLAAASGAAPGALSGALILAAVWALLATGMAAVAAAPPPSDAFPFQDLTHLAGLVLGALAAVATWRELARNHTPGAGRGQAWRSCCWLDCSWCRYSAGPTCDHPGSSWRRARIVQRSSSPARFC